jgi:hypothetical protein
MEPSFWRGPGVKPRAAVLAALIVVSGCGSGGVEQELASVGFPPTWEVAKTTTNNGCVPLGDPYCPSATAYLVTPPDLLTVYQAARDAIAADGYEIRDFTHDCDGVPDLPPCSFTAHRNGFNLDLNVYNPGEDVDRQGVSKADHATIRVIVRRG